MPYSKSSFVDQKSSDCELRCTNPNISDRSRLSYRLPNDKLQIQVEIIKHGPVVAEMMVYEDLLYYSNGKINSNTTFKMTFSKKLIVLGIYEHVVGEKFGTDLVELVEWGSDQSVTVETNDDRVKYWRVVPSWDDEWASKGFKIVRGTNQCGVELKLRAGRRFPSLLVAPIWFIIMSVINSVVLINCDFSQNV
jgi:hypothetical protein